MIYSNDALGRSIANSGIDAVTGQKIKSKAAIALMDKFVNTEWNPSYYAKQHDLVDARAYKTVKSLEGLTPAERENLVKSLQNPMDGSVTGNTLDSARIFATTFKEIIDMAKANKIDIGDVEGYFPRIPLHEKIIANEFEFIEDATEAYRQTDIDWHAKNDREYISTPELEDSYAYFAERWYEKIQIGNDGIFANLAIGKDEIPKPKHMKNFSKAANDIMREWYNQNPDEVMVSYLRKMARRIVFQQEFGDGKYKEMEKAMREEGLSNQQVEEIRDILAVNTGVAWGRKTGLGADFSAVMRLLTVFRFLGGAVRNAVIEPFVSGAQSGSIREGITAFKDSMDFFLKQKAPQGLKNYRPELDAFRDLSDLLGFSSEINQDVLVNSRSGAESIPEKYQKTMQRFFDLTQISPYTLASKAAAFKGATRLINRLSSDIVNNTSLKKSSEYLLRKQLGIPQDKIPEFAQWVHSTEFSKIPLDDFLQDSSDHPFMDLYRNATRSYVESAIQTPTAADKQRFATHPYAGMLYSLTGFVMAFERNVLKQNFGFLKEGIKGKGYTTNDRLRLGYPFALTLGMLTIVASGMQALWDTINRTPQYKESPLHKTLSIISNAGLLGRYSSLVNTGLFASGNLGKLTQGPLVGDMLQFGSDITAGNKRGIAKGLVNLMVVPAANAGLTAAESVNPGAAFLALQLINSPGIKRMIVDATGGKPKSRAR